MKQVFLFLTLNVLILTGLNAQTIKGTLQDAADQSAVGGATLKLLKSDSSKTSFEIVSNSKGLFTFKDIPSDKYILVVTSIGFSDFKKSITVQGNPLDLGKILLSKTAQTLEGIVLNSTPPPVRQKNDTLEMAASQYKVNPDATSEDLIKKMPGITVDKSGAVTANGESVKKVTVDGRDFFGDDATATLRNLPAEIVDKIQVFDKLSDQAQLTGFDDGNTSKSINIVTKKDMRSGNFGRIYAGYGSDNTYSAGGNVSFFNNARRISLVGLTNNINQQNFSSQDILGVSGGGGGRGGGGNNFSVGQQSGIAKTNGLGINYSDAWGKKIDVTGSYFFNNSNTSNNQTTNRQNFITSDTTVFIDGNTVSNSVNYNNRVNFRMNYKIDSNNTLIVTSGLSFQKNNSVDFLTTKSYYNDESQISNNINDLTSNNNGYNINNGLLLRHAFQKKGRSVSLGFNTSFSKNDGDNFSLKNDDYVTNSKSIMTNQLATRKNNSTQYSFNLVYTEPVGVKGQLQLNYNPSFRKNSSDQETFDYDSTSSKYSLFNNDLSNVFDNTYNTQTTGLTYRYGDRNNMISAGVSYQNSELNSNQVFPKVTRIDNTYNNFLANAFGRVKLSAKSNLRVIYRSSVSAPSVNQLQNVINNTNSLFWTTGNPNLKQQYTNNLITRYNFTNTSKSQSFFANLFLSSINNYITNDTYTASKDSTVEGTTEILHKGSQISKPVNVNGYLSARSFFTYSMPITFLKSNINLNAGLSYSNSPGLTSGIASNSNNLNYNFGAVLSSNISEYIDFNLSYSTNFNEVNNSFQPSQNSNYRNQSFGLTANLLTKKGSFFQNDISNQSYSGLAAGLNQSYWLWNMAIGQKFLKGEKGELKLSVFDLLKQNQSISRDVTDPTHYVQDTRNQVLQQYFMLTFTYKLKTFGKPSANARGQQNDFRREGGGGFGGNHGGMPAPSL